MTNGERLLAVLRSLQEKLDLGLLAAGRAVGEVTEVLAASGEQGPDRGGLARTALALDHYCLALESTAEAVIRAFDPSPPSGPDWHRTLLESASRPAGARPAVLRSEVAARLKELLGFRHFLQHAYAVDLDWTRRRHLVEGLLALHVDVEADLHEFREFVGACAREVEADGAT